MNNKQFAGEGEDRKMRKLFVDKLNASITEEDIFNVFSKYGDIEEVAKYQDRRAPSRYFAFVVYKYAKDCAKATCNPCPIIKGRKCACMLAAIGKQFSGYKFFVQKGLLTEDQKKAALEEQQKEQRQHQNNNNNHSDNNLNNKYAKKPRQRIYKNRNRDKIENNQQPQQQNKNENKFDTLNANMSTFKDESFSSRSAIMDNLSFEDSSATNFECDQSYIYKSYHSHSNLSSLSYIPSIQSIPHSSGYHPITKHQQQGQEAAAHSMYHRRMNHYYSFQPQQQQQQQESSLYPQQRMQSRSMSYTQTHTTYPSLTKKPPPTPAIIQSASCGYIERSQSPRHSALRHSALRISQHSSLNLNTNTFGHKMIADPMLPDIVHIIASPELLADNFAEIGLTPSPPPPLSLNNAAKSNIDIDLQQHDNIYFAQLPVFKSTDDAKKESDQELEAGFIMLASPTASACSEYNDSEDLTNIIDECIDKPQPDNIMYSLGGGNEQKSAAKTNNNHNNSKQSTDKDANGNQQRDDTHNNNCGGGGDGNGRKRRDDDDWKKKQNNNVDNDEDDDEDNDEEDEDDKEQKEEEEKAIIDEQMISTSQSKLNVNAPSYVPTLPSMVSTASTSSIASSVTSSLSTIDEETSLNISCDEYMLEETKEDIGKSCTNIRKCKKRRKQNHSKKRLLTNEYSKKYEKYAIYDPPSRIRARGHIQISKKFTKSVPRIISENISDIFSYIDKNTALQDKYEYNDGKIRILNYDFHDRTSNEILYCIAERQNESNNRGCKWRMKDTLFTNNDIQCIYGISIDKLPKSIRATDAFNYDNYHYVMNQISEKSKHLVGSMKWNKIPVYSKEPNRRSCRTKLSMTIEELRKKLIYFIDNTQQKHKIIPIAMFKDNAFCIQYLWIVTIQTEVAATNIAVALEYNMKQNDIKPVGIHLDKESIINNWQLFDPAAIDNDLKNFQCRFEDMSVGNVDEDANLIKAQQFEINRLKKIIEQINNNNDSSSPSLSYTEHSITSTSSADNAQIN